MSEIIKKNICILAPLAGYSDVPYRKIANEFGMELAFTEMISSDSLIRKKKNLCARITKNEKIVGQLFGSDPVLLSNAAVILEERGFLGVDINMGCSVRKVLKKSSGAALLSEPHKIEKIIKTVRNKIKIPLSIKIRSGCNKDSLNFLEIGKIAEDNGVNFITLHPRTRDDLFANTANWDHIKQLSKSINIPVIGNGDIKTCEDGKKMLSKTGCHAVMIGRACLGNPWFFKQWNDKTYIVSNKEKAKTIIKHLEQAIIFYGEKLGVLKFRKHLVKYCKGIKNSTELRRNIFSKNTLKEIEKLIEDFFI